MPAMATTAVAEYTVNTYTLTVQSTPPTALSIGSSTGDGGTTNYPVSSRRVRDERGPRGSGGGSDRVHLLLLDDERNGSGCGCEGNHAHDARDGHDGGGVYTLNTYTLTVQSAPPTGLSIGSSTGYSGTTNYTVPSVGYGTSVNLRRPGDGPGRAVYLHAMDGQRRGADIWAAVHYVRDVR